MKIDFPKQKESTPEDLLRVLEADWQEDKRCARKIISLFIGAFSIALISNIYLLKDAEITTQLSVYIPMIIGGAIGLLLICIKLIRKKPTIHDAELWRELKDNIVYRKSIPTKKGTILKLNHTERK